MATRSLRVSAELALRVSAQEADFKNSFSHDMLVGREYGYETYLSHKDLTAKPEAFLVDKDRLVIECKMILLPEAGHRSFQCGVNSSCSKVLPSNAQEVTVEDRQTWDVLMEPFVDLGPSTVIMVFKKEEDDDFDDGERKEYFDVDEKKEDEEKDDGVEELCCHSFPLAARSPVFQAMLTAEMRERHSGRIEITDMSAATGKELLFYMYTDRLRPGADLRKLLAAADKYGISELKNICGEALCGTISDTNCVELLVLGDRYAVPDLKELAMEHIQRNRCGLVKLLHWDQPLKGQPGLITEIVERLFMK